MNLFTLMKERAALKYKRMNTPIVIKKTKYSYESNLSLQLGELSIITEKLADIATDYAEFMGCGGECFRIKNVLEELNVYYKKSIRFLEGNDWEDLPIKERKTKETYDGNILGYSQEEIARKQGGGPLP